MDIFRGLKNFDKNKICKVRKLKALILNLKIVASYHLSIKLILIVKILDNFNQSIKKIYK